MNKTDLAKLDRGTLVALIFKQTASVTGAFEEWTSDLTHAGNDGFGSTPLDAIVESIHPATPRPA